MKKMILLSTITMILGTVHAQTNTSQNSVSTELNSSAENLEFPFLNTDSLELTVEYETATKRDDTNSIEGSESYLQIEPGYKLSKSVNLRLGTTYFVREMEGTRKDDESRNRDHLADIYTKVIYKAAAYKTNGIADLRLQARAYSDQDDFFKRRYAADGNYQLRAYFGRPLAGGVYLNKYTSYVRYKNYFNNDSVNRFSRDYELRTRISPTYRLKNGAEVGTTFTYNHIFKVQKTNDEENIDLDLFARYQKGSYAILGRVGFQIMNNEEGDSVLKSNDDAGKEFGYALTLAAYL